MFRCIVARSGSRASAPCVVPRARARTRTHPRSWSSDTAPQPSSRVGLWIALGLATVGGAGYWYTRHKFQQMSRTLSDRHSSSPADLPPNSPFSTKPTVIFVLGGPGAGKGTQCARLVKDYDFVHLSAGDLLRDERSRPGSEVGELINTHIKEGKIVPMEITIKLLETAMLKSGKSRFLIDGFPRKLDQAEAFENMVAVSDFILYFECPEKEMERRLLDRGKTSGRVDDNIESIRKRFLTFRDTSYPVIDKYRTLGKVHQVSCLDTPDNVYAKVRVIFDKMFTDAAATRH